MSPVSCCGAHVERVGVDVAHVVRLPKADGGTHSGGFVTRYESAREAGAGRLVRFY